MPTIVTLPPSNVTNTSATFRFEVTYDGNPNSDGEWEATFAYKPHSSFEWILSEKIFGSGEGTYYMDMTGLSEHTQYDVTSTINNTAGTAPSNNTETFCTDIQLGLPVVSTKAAQNITWSSVKLELLLLDDGNPSDATQADTRFTYWSNEKQKSTDWLATTEGQKSIVSVSGLDPDTVYYFSAQARNSVGQVNGSTLSFKTSPDPNVCPLTFEPNEPNTLLIQNFIKSFQSDPNSPHKNQGFVTYIEGIGLNEKDLNDVTYSDPAYARESKIVSIAIQNTESQLPDDELSRDARPDNAQDALIELSIFSPWPNDPNITSENCLKFWLAKNAFMGKTITIQKVSFDPNITFPIWDVNQIITKNCRQMPLNNLVNQKVNKSYCWLTLSTSREIIDLNYNGIIDINDYQLLLVDMGKEGIFRSDIAGVKGLGLPDGKVDANDEKAFITEYNKRNPANPLPNPYEEISEDFESAIFREPFTSSGDKSWIIDTSTSYGNYCAKSGDIEDNQVSTLEANIDTLSGNVSFYVKVFCEFNYDNLIFYVDNVEAGRWSGNQDWKKVDFQITAGAHNFKWSYMKDSSESTGEDAVWIDNIKFPTF